MLINSGHKIWFLSTVVLGVLALALYGWLRRHAPGGLSGGSTVGLWYGLGGMALIVYAWLLALLRRLPMWRWLGRRQIWLKGHIWLGLLSAVLLLCHGGFRWGGPLERLLWVVLGLTLATGVLGLLLQQFLPRLLTTHVPHEAPYDQIPQVCVVLRHQADQLIQTLEAVPVEAAEPGMPPVEPDRSARVQVREFHEQHVRPFLAGPVRRASPLANPLWTQAAFARLRALPGFAPLRNEVTQLERICEERRQLAEQDRLFLWLHGWLLVHVPLAGALLLLGLAHALVALYY